MNVVDQSKFIAYEGNHERMDTFTYTNLEYQYHNHKMTDKKIVEKVRVML